MYTPRRRTAGRITVQTAAAAKRVRRTRPRRRSALPIRPLRCTAWGPSRWDNSGDAEMARSLWSRAHAALHVGFARVCSELNGLTSAASALSSPRPHLHRDWGSPRPHCLHRDWAHPAHTVCTGSGAHPAHICCVAGARRSRFGYCCAEYSTPLLRHPSRLPLQPVNTAVASPHVHAALTW